MIAESAKFLELLRRAEDLFPKLSTSPKDNTLIGCTASGDLQAAAIDGISSGNPSRDDLQAALDKCRGFVLADLGLTEFGGTYQQLVDRSLTKLDKRFSSCGSATQGLIAEGGSTDSGDPGFVGYILEVWVLARLAGEKASTPLMLLMQLETDCPNCLEARKRAAEEAARKKKEEESKSNPPAGSSAQPTTEPTSAGGGSGQGAGGGQPGGGTGQPSSAQPSCIDEACAPTCKEAQQAAFDFRNQCSLSGWSMYACVSFIRRLNHCPDTALILPTPDGDHTCGRRATEEEIRAMRKRFCERQQGVAMVCVGHPVRILRRSQKVSAEKTRRHL